MELVSIIQARMSSSRLPGKVLLPLGTVTVLDQVVRRAEQFSAQVVVCTSVDSEDDPIAAHCASHGVLCVRGSLDNVFQRYRDVLLHDDVLETSWFARVTADSPLVSPTLARTLCVEAVQGLDYVAVQYDRTPLGVAVELIRRSAFLSIDPETLDRPEREHVTVRLYEDSARYQSVRVVPPVELQAPECRLTLDYSEDYELLQQLFADDNVSAVRAIARMRSEPDLAAINATCVQNKVRP